MTAATVSRRILRVISAGILTIATCRAATAGRTDDPAAACHGLEVIPAFSRIPDARTEVVEAEVIDQERKGTSHCRVQGYIAPRVGFVLKLPESWNRKFIEVGCGGYCGSTDLPLFTSWCDEAVDRGYACIVTDQGHASPKVDNPLRDAAWAYDNLQAEIDYGFRAAHVAALSGKAVTRQYYGMVPELSYFMGCSGGGRQALVEAQRFPRDFDGIIAMDPAINLTATLLAAHWNALAVIDRNGNPVLSPADIVLVHEAAVDRCDLDDNLRDGVVVYPPACKFDPAELLCAGEDHDGCLSSAQLTAVQKVYSGPATSAGRRLFHGGAMPGSETGRFGLSAGAEELRTDFFRYMAFMPDPGPSFDARSFDFEEDYQRLGMMEMIYAADNPDLRNFKARGGRLIIAQGWDNSGLPPLRSVDYYEMAERVMGGREQMQEFARLFMIPGRAHCLAGEGPNAIDFLRYLEDWVERGIPPDRLIAAHIESDIPADYLKSHGELRDKVLFTRPIYPWPIRYRYLGTGDATDHRNFGPFDPRAR